MPDSEKYRYITDPEHPRVSMVVRQSDGMKLGTVWPSPTRGWRASTSDWYRGRRPEGTIWHSTKKGAAGFLDAVHRAAAAEYTPGQHLFWLLADGTRRGGVVESRGGRDTLIVTQAPEGDRTPGVRIGIEDVAREMQSSAVNGLPRLVN